MQRELEQLFNLYPLKEGYKPEYGTAGFRSKADNLDAVVFRCSALMSVRSQNTGKFCGIMITASHNPECDNGVKLIDYNGEMIDEELQLHATNLAQASTFHVFWTYLSSVKHASVKHEQQVTTGGVLIGIDTRKSGQRLSYIATESIHVCDGYSIDLGYVTTPELHFYTLQWNMTQTIQQHSYTKHLSDAFHSAVQSCVNATECEELHVDCANGIGAGNLELMKQDLLASGLRLILYNTGNGKLNHECGADYVEKENKFPSCMHDIPEYARCCSLDGDADRIVYFTKVNGQFKLLNGDKIACLFVKYLSGITTNSCTIGLVQTAYANGASTRYVLDNYKNVQVQCTHTGVQNLHQAAHSFDIGVYFEANGHGTVLFKKDVCKGQHTMQHLMPLLSQVTGDAIGNMLAIEYILRTNTSFDDWNKLYVDYYTKQEKIYTDKNRFETCDYGRLCVKPSGLQKEIDTIVELYKTSNTRAFIRPSGTEELVRLYIESKDRNCLSDVSDKIKYAIQKYNM
jgi:phosphoacetylglucosamine mutase